MCSPNQMYKRLTCSPDCPRLGLGFSAFLRHMG